MKRAALRALDGLKNTTYLRRWLVLGGLIGVVAGVGAIVFIHALDLATELLLGGLGGYTPPGPVGEGHAAGSAGFDRPWAIPLVVGLGGLVSGLLTVRFAPEAEGHGTDAAIEAFHHNPGGVRPRAVLVKILASAVTIGAGGSAGREGPTAQVSAGFGSLLGRVLRLSPSDARIAVAAGIGSGIGAIFRAPLGGAVLGAEILYREDVEAEALLPSVVASVVGFSIFGAAEGFTPIFGFVRAYRFVHPVELAYFALLGLVAGAVGRLYARSFYGVVSLTKRLRGSAILKPAAAGLLVGLIGLAFPEALGTGYGWVQKVMTKPSAVPVWVVLALPFVKILATSLSVGSGGSGGIFGPGMVIGAFVGAGMWHLLHPVAPSVPDNPAPFMIVGMVACFGSISHALLGVMLMVAEMTGSLALLPPAMIALGTAALVVGDSTMYTGQLKDRVESTAHRLKFGLPLMASVPASGVMSSPRLVLPAHLTGPEALRRLVDAGLPGAPVTDGEGALKGAVETAALATCAEEAEHKSLSQLLDPDWPMVACDATLEDVVDALVTNNVVWVAVIDADRRLAGIVGMTEVLDGYRQVLRSSLRQLSRVGGDSVLVEETVTDGAPVSGVTVSEIRGPHALATLAELGDGRVVDDLGGRRGGQHLAGDGGVGEVAVVIGVAIDDDELVGEFDGGVAVVAAALLGPEVDAVAAGPAGERLDDLVGSHVDLEDIGGEGPDHQHVVVVGADGQLDGRQAVGAGHLAGDLVVVLPQVDHVPVGRGPLRSRAGRRPIDGEAGDRVVEQVGHIGPLAVVGHRHGHRESA